VSATCVLLITEVLPRDPQLAKSDHTFTQVGTKKLTGFTSFRIPFFALVLCPLAASRLSSTDPARFRLLLPLLALWVVPWPLEVTASVLFKFVALEARAFRLLFLPLPESSEGEGRRLLPLG
jgi:hypothetical protein